MSINPKYKAASFYDLDGTLLSGNGSFYFGLFLLKKRKVSLRKFAALYWNYLLCKIGKRSIEELHNYSFQTFFKHQNEDEFKNLACEFVDSAFERLINPKVFRELSNSRERGELTVILSSAPEFLVTHFARKSCVDFWRGTVYQTYDGNWLEIDQILEGSSKSKHLKEICKRFGVSLSNTTAYSDHHNDLPFLEAAGKAVAVSPTKQLRKISLQKGWLIIGR